MRLVVSREVRAARTRVWETLTHWERQPDWMVDARSVEVLTPVRTGEGVVLRCPTSLLGVTVEDVMRVILWEPPARLGVVHLGRAIAGTGVFELEELDPTHTRVVWREEITPPLGAIGAGGARILRPVLERIFARSLVRLGAIVEAEADRSG